MIRRALAGVSILLSLVLGIVYALRPDAWAAVTVLPAWVWAAPGLGLAALAWRAGRWAGVSALCWLLFLLVHSEEVRSLRRPRAWDATVSPAPGALRVVTLNCAGGDAAAAGEVAAVHPDVVLLQESPGEREVVTLARRLFGAAGGVVCGPDATILARGTVRDTGPRPVSPGFVQARVTLAGGRELEVVSLRLTPATVRYDLWSPSCWREQMANRQVRQAELSTVAARISVVPGGTPLIVGGDFNAPAGDAIFRVFRPRLRDAWREGGTGWGNTILGDAPFHRIDQIWIDAGFAPRSVAARRTRRSDHRMVVADLAFRRTTNDQ